MNIKKLWAAQKTKKKESIVLYVYKNNRKSIKEYIKEHSLVYTNCNTRGLQKCWKNLSDLCMYIRIVILKLELKNFKKFERLQWCPPQAGIWTLGGYIRSKGQKNKKTQKRNFFFCLRKCKPCPLVEDMSFMHVHFILSRVYEKIFVFCECTKMNKKKKSFTFEIQW